MSICSLRAHCRYETKKTVTFTIADIPLLIGEDVFVLLKRPFSPILKLDTLVLGTDTDVFQHDVLESDGELWFVVFDRGFVAYNKDKTKRRFLYEFDKYKVVREMTEEEITRFNSKLYTMKFKYGTKIFTIKNVVGMYQSKIMVSSVSHAFDTSEIHQDTNVPLSRFRTYYGELYKGRKLIMCYGRVCIQNEFGVYDIVEGTYITRK